MRHLRAHDVRWSDFFKVEPVQVCWHNYISGPALTELEPSEGSVAVMIIGIPVILVILVIFRLGAH